MPRAEPLLIRVDAGGRAGTGHLMRSLALAHAWAEGGGKAHFAVAQAPAGILQRLTSEGLAVARVRAPAAGVEDAAETAALLRDLGAPWLVVDGYGFGAAYQGALRERGVRLLYVDDYGHIGHYDVDLLLNQNLYATPALYPSRAPRTRLLLGARYAMLRREFRAWRDRARDTAPGARRVLVTMGGSDPDDATTMVLRALATRPEPRLEVLVVLGAANARVEAVRREGAMSPHGVRVLTDVRDMPALMAWADLAVTAAGSTCWEMAFMGVPMVAVVLAENQLPIARSLAAAGAARDAGWAAALEPARLADAIASLAAGADERRRMSERGRAVVDGLGASRVAHELRAAS